MTVSDLSGLPTDGPLSAPAAGPSLAAVVVLAAGEGTRMRSATPKVLHEIGGRSLVGHALDAARALDPERLIVVVGHGRDRVAPAVHALDAGAEVVVQEEQLGTADAVQVAISAAPGLAGPVLVTYADVPLLTPATLGALLARHAAGEHVATVLTAVVADPTGYGRILRDRSGALLGNVEHRDATEDQRAIAEINSGVYAFDGAFLADALTRIGTDNVQGERYLPDVLGLARAAGHRIGAVAVEDPSEVLGVNDRVQLADLRRRLNDRILQAWMRAGVTVVDPATTWVETEVTLEHDVVLLPGVSLEGATSVGAGARIGPDSTLRDTLVAEDAVVVRSHLVGAQVGPAASVGPFAYLRPGAVLGAASKVGTFVEVKGSTLGAEAKVPHLSYVGDAEIGTGTNIGAATVFVNYDGVAKHRSTVGEHCRTGADNMFVAPVHIGDGAYTAAGSVITQDVPSGAMAVSRARQRNVEGWVQRRRPGTAAAEAAERALARDQDEIDPAANEGTP